MMYEMLDISFPEGTTYVLVVDTDRYSGHLKRALAAYVTGTYDKEQGYGWREYEKFLEDSSKEGWEDIAYSLQDASTTVQHNNRGAVSSTIRATPGRISDNGNHRDAEPGETGMPAYESVAIFFNRHLMKPEMEIVRQRAKKFAEQFIKPLTIRDIYMTRIVMERTETRLDI